MAAQSDSRPFLGTGSGIPRHEVSRKWSGPIIAAAVNLPQGSIAGALLTDTNEDAPIVYPFVGDNTMRALGFVTKGCDNTSGIQGAREIDVLAQTGRMVDKNAGGGSAIAQTDIYKPAYGYDNQTVSKLSGDGPCIGMLLGLDPDTGEPIVLVDPVVAGIFLQIVGVSAPLAVNQGGTGKTSITAHKLLVGNGTSAPTELDVGASGQVLAGVTGADPGFRALLASDIPSEGGIYRAFVSLTNNQTKALHATPVQVIAQPASGYYVEIVSFQAYLVYATAAFDSVAATDYLELRYTDGSGALLVDAVSPAGFGDASADAYINIRPATSYAPARAPVMAYIAGTEWYSAAGGGHLNLTVLYRLRTLAPTS